MNSAPIRGLVVAAHTPFHADGSLHPERIELQAAHFLRNDLRFVFIGGTTGESHSLTLDERRALARRWFEVARGTPLQIIVHVGANCLEDARMLAAQAQELGAVAVSALAPSYFKPRTLSDLVACCAQIAGGAPGTPFYYYDIPVFTGLQFSVVDLFSAAGRSIPNFAGAKFTNPDLATYLQCLHADEGRWDVLWGMDECLLAALATGARGAIGSSFNFAAPISQRLMAAFEQGDLIAAREGQLRLVRLIQLLARHGYMGAAKATMKMLGVDVGPPRLPNASLTAKQEGELRAGLEALGFFDWVK